MESKQYAFVNNIEENLNSKVELKIYDSQILSRFNYNVKLTPWLKEGISQEAIDQAIIGYYPGGDAITIPHFNIDGDFIGLRGRVLNLTSNYLTLEIPKSNINIYKDILYIDLLEIEKI